MSEDLLWPHLKELPYFRATLRSVEARLMQAVDFPIPVLDVGCGDGHFASVTFSSEIDVGADPAWRPLKEARMRGAYRLLCQADGTRLPYRDGAFSSALSNSVLEHIPRLDAVLAEVGRVLRPGAPFAVTVPNPGYRNQLSIPQLLQRVGLRSFARVYRDWFIWISRTFHLLEPEEWEEHLVRAGFEVEETTHYFSPAALRALEWGHYLGFPCLIVRWVTGRWILVPAHWNLKLTEMLVRRYYNEGPIVDGTYSFFLARKR